MKNVLIYGFGRMGLTHYAILNRLIDNAQFTFVEVDKKLKSFAKNNIKANIVSSEPDVNCKYDIALICTPPMFHISLLEMCLKRGDSVIFVEKPFGGIEDDFSRALENKEKIYIGYVMRFNPIIKWAKENIDIGNVEKVESSYFSNTIEKKPKGWRNGSYSGVSNEVGAHVIDLTVNLFGLNSPVLIDKNIQSNVSDVDDIVSAEFEENGIEYSFHFDWVNKNYRKPIFKLNVIMNDNVRYKIDQQKVEIFKGNTLRDTVSTVDIAETVPFYLRGIDFTKQMQDLIGDRNTLATVDEALVTRNLIKNLINS